MRKVTRYWNLESGMLLSGAKQSYHDEYMRKRGTDKYNVSESSETSSLLTDRVRIWEFAAF